MKKMMPRTQTSMRLKSDTLYKLKFLKRATGLSMARVLALIVDDYLKHHGRKDESKS